MIHEPLRIAGTVLVGLLTLAALRLLSRYVLIYGRRRIVIAVLIGFVFGALSRNLLVFRWHDTPVDVRTIGYVIPGSDRELDGSPGHRADALRHGHDGGDRAPAAHAAARWEPDPMSLARASTPALAALALLSLTLYALAERSLQPAHADAFHKKIEAVKLMQRAEKMIGEARHARGLERRSAQRSGGLRHHRPAVHAHHHGSRCGLREESRGPPEFRRRGDADAAAVRRERRGPGGGGHDRLAARTGMPERSANTPTTKGRSRFSIASPTCTS